MTEQITRLEILRPDDWHVHLRDNEALLTTVPDLARTFGRAIVMPNLEPPVISPSDARAYKRRILAARPNRSDFEPLMTLYLNDTMRPDDIDLALKEGHVHGVKYYPAGATTNSEAGVRALNSVMPTLERMSETGMPLLVHGEVTDHEVDIFDREKKFIESVLIPITKTLPDLKVVLEHISSKDAVDYVLGAGNNVAATITVHHLLFNRNDIFVGGIKPHFFCLPILKRSTHQEALIAAATSGNKKFFLGTDSAPHGIQDKETSCGCAGIYTAPAAIELYAEVFEAANALDRLESFASKNGPDFYGLPKPIRKIVLEKLEWRMPTSIAFGKEKVAPIRAGEIVNWRLVETKT
jgi:dihydroorotase